MDTIEKFSKAVNIVENELLLNVDAVALDSENETQVIVLTYDPTNSIDSAYAVYSVDITGEDGWPYGLMSNLDIDQAKYVFNQKF